MKRRAMLGTVAGGLVTCAMAQAKEAEPKSAPKQGNWSPKSVPPTFKIENGQVKMNPDQRLVMSKCFGCFNICGACVTVDEKTNRVVRVTGNPYALNARAADPIPMETPVAEALKQMQVPGTQPATLCGRGNAVIDAMNDPHRLTRCLKRVGKRGDNRWVSISYEQLLDEVINGGDLFGEGPVEGLAAIYRKEGLANPQRPDFGPYKNRLLVSYNSEQGARTDLLKRFAVEGWGTVNLGCKDSYCGHQQVAGCAMGAYDAVDQGDLPTTDYQHCRFAIFMGTTPGLSGIGLNSANSRLAQASCRPDFEYVVVDPILRAISKSALPRNGTWIPMKPGGDSAFLFGLMYVMFKEDRINHNFLSNPNEEVAKAHDQINVTNAAALVILDPKHPNYLKLLRGSDLGLEDADGLVIKEKGTGHWVTMKDAKDQAQLWVDETIETKSGAKIPVKTTLLRLKERVMEKPLYEYAREAGLPVETIEKLARKFTNYGQAVSLETNTGCSTSDAGMMAFVVNIIGTLVGAHNHKGGMLHAGGCGLDCIFDIYEGPYNFKATKLAEEEGVPAERSGRYEDSFEYKARVKAGKNPYPAEQPWNETIIQENSGEMLVAHANNNPFTFKAWLIWSTNPLYNCSGLARQVKDSIVDPKVLPLIIGVDAYVNETNQYADYLIPDAMQYEQWMAARMWGSEYMGSVVAMPAVTPKTVKTKDGKPVTMEQFVLDLGNRLKLPGFGKDVIEHKNGKKRSLVTVEDWYFPLFANMAMGGETPLPSIDEGTKKLLKLDRVEAQLKKVLAPEEVGPVLMMLSRGGRFEVPQSRYEGDFFCPDLRLDNMFLLFNEALGRTKDSYTGKTFDPQPVLMEAQFWDGSSVRSHYPEHEYPFLVTSFKAQLRSPYSAALPRVTGLCASNAIHMNELDAKRVRVENGDWIEVISPQGTRVTGRAQVDDTVARGAIVIPTGYGHTQFGATARTEDGVTIERIPERGAGVAVNFFNVVDPTRPGKSLYRDKIFGSTARHALPVKVQKLA